MTPKGINIIDAPIPSVSPKVSLAVGKSILFLLIFLVLHFAYRWLPFPAVEVFSANNESFVQHAKIGFFSYSLLSVIEYFLLRRRGPVGNFWGSRLLAVVILPWVMFVMWYTAPTFYGRLPSPRLDTFYSILVAFLLGMSLSLIEQELQKTVFTRIIFALLVFLYLLSMAQMIAFTYQVPWAGFFTE